MPGFEWTQPGQPRRAALHQLDEFSIERPAVLLPKVQLKRRLILVDLVNEKGIRIVLLAICIKRDISWFPTYGTCKTSEQLIHPDCRLVAGGRELGVQEPAGIKPRAISHSRLRS